MIGIFLGTQDSGKTLAMSYYGYDYFKKGYKIYSNYNLSFKHKKITKEILTDYVNNRKSFNKAIFLIDELYLIFDSRSSVKKFNKVFSYFVLQTSKRDVHLFGTAQFFNTVDIRFRDNISFVCFCFRYIKTEKGFKEINIGKRFLDDELNDILYIKQVFLIKKGLENYKKKIYYIKASPIFNIYDTKELLGLE